MSASDSLPVILVSAVDAAAATVLISEIIEEGGPSKCIAECAGGAVWRLANKYYTASARLLPLPDDAAPPLGLDVQAHVIYLTEDECSDGAAAAASVSRRAGRARALVPRAGVRLVAARAAREGAWARERGYEPVALLAPPPADDALAETRGAARLREALHAHAWPGMRSATALAARPPRDDESDGSAESDESWGEWVTGGGEEEAEGRAGLFADAFALLPAREPLREPGRDDAARRLRAEQLVVAFCQALGHDLRLDTGGDGEQ